VKSKARFLPFVLALALLTSLFVLSPATAATGTVKLSKSFITTPGGELTITVEDEDLNFGVVQSDEEQGQDARVAGQTAVYTIPARTTPYTPDSVLRYRTQKAPIQSASDADLYPDVEGADDVDRFIRVDFSDVILRMVSDSSLNETTTAQVITAWNAFTTGSGRSPAVAGDRHPFALENTQGGAFILRTDEPSVTVPVDIEFTVSYKAPDVQDVDVTLSSTQDITGITLNLAETGADTGKFTGSFQTAGASDEDSSPPGIASIAGSLITVTYDDDGTRRVANATVETTDPTILITAPEHDYSTRVRSARLIAEVTDADSGIDKDTIMFEVTPTNLAGGSVAGPGVTVTDVTTVAIAGGFKAEVQLANVPAGETEITWYVTVMDEAGNLAESDRDDSEEGRQDYSIRIDTVAPALGTISIDSNGDEMNNRTVDGAITGNHLDDDNKAVTNAGKGDDTSIRVVFNEALDEGSLAASDFRVNGVAPSDVAWSSKHPESAFLKVASLDSAARPLVEVTGDIADTAGNIRPGGLKVENAMDGISPTLEVEIEPTYHKEEVTIRVRSNEPLLTVPTINLNDSDSPVGLSVPRLIATDHYSTVFKAPTQPEIFNVNVSAQDTSANAASIGEAAPGDDDAITFEIDKNLPAPTSITLPGHGAIIHADISADAYKITTMNPFITIEWDSEASEYDEDSHKTVDFTDLMIGDFEVNTPMGEETGARSDWGDDSPVVFNVTKPTDNRLLISARSLALGTYTLSFNGADELGNALGDPVTIDIEVKEPDPFSISLTPGWNLVSLPAEPQASGINDVMGDHAASIVLTYDPTQPGAWLSSSRGDDGVFAGSLESIGARTAYWIFTDGFDSIKVPITRPTGGGVTLLPTVNLVAGWNLLPVLDVGGGAAFGDDAASVGDYVDNVVRTYSYDGSSDRFDQLSGMLQIGSGYWAYLSAATVLVP
jgi:hypothetical protein